jgi:aspartyl protease family protein
MPDIDNKRPWGRPPERSRSKTGFVIWLVLLIAMGFGVWKLSELFPGQLSSDFDRANLIWLLVLVAVISAGVVRTGRRNLGELSRNIAIWLGVAAVLIVGISYRTELENVALRVRSELIPGYGLTTTPGVLVLNESEDGHFYTVSEANGVRVRFLIDTGASDTGLSPAAAERLGIDVKALDYSRVFGSANGMGRSAPFTLASLHVGPIELTNVPVSINQAEMGSSLLGMSFLKRLQSFEVQDRRLYLRWR